MDHHQDDLSAELDPALLMSASTSSSSPPGSASPSSSFSHPSPPHYTLAVSDLSCPAPRRRASILPSFLSSCFSTSPATDASGGGERLLLKSVSFTASSSNILAVVGPSGAGKSTLLRILSGRGTGSEIARPGTVSLNGHAVTSRAQLRRLCGFVTQDDNLLPLLTVRETILFAARFRLRGGAATARERLDRAEALIQELGLSEVADSYVGGGGDGAARGVSGGERKRVSIAVDMVHDPPVLLLDEPTSGLDSRSAVDVLALLREVSRARRQVVVLSIHQPSYRMLGYISSLLLLSRGAVAHSGTLKSLEDALARLGHKIPAQLNPLELAMETEVTAELAEDRYRHGAGLLLLDEDAVSSSSLLLDSSSNDVAVPDRGGYYCSRATEVSALAVRCWRTMYRTRELFAARGAQAVVGGLGLGSVYFRLSPDGPDGVALRLGLFAFTLSFLLSSTVEALPILLHERRVLMREASRRAYRLSSYVAANALVFAPCLLAVALLFAGPLYWLAGLRAAPRGAAAFAFFVLAVWLIVLMASSLVLFLSAVSPDFVLGNALICVCLGVFFLFSGYFIPRGSIPRYWAFMYYVSMYRYPLDLLLINEYGGGARGRCVAWVGGNAAMAGGGVCLRTGADVLRDRGIDEGMKWANVGVMLGFFLLYRVMCWAVLVRRASKTTL